MTLEPPKATRPFYDEVYRAIHGPKHNLRTGDNMHVRHYPPGYSRKQLALDTRNLRREVHWQGAVPRLKWEPKGRDHEDGSRDLVWATFEP